MQRKKEQIRMYPDEIGENRFKRVKWKSKLMIVRAGVESATGFYEVGFWRSF